MWCAFEVYMVFTVHKVYKYSRGEQQVGYVVCQPAVHQVYIYSRCTQVGDVVRPAICIQGVHSASGVQMFKVYNRLVM